MKTKLITLLLPITYLVLAGHAKASGAQTSSASSDKQKVSSAKDQEQSIIDWSSGVNGKHSTTPSFNKQSQELPKGLVKPLQQSQTEQPNKEEVDRLEAALKLIKSEQAGSDLKSVGDSIISLRRKLTDNPHSHTERLRLAIYLYVAGDSEGAASELKQSIATSPTDYVSHALLGRILGEAGERESATLALRQAIALAPNIASTHYLYAESLIMRGNLSEAINEYRRAIGIKPSASAFARLAEALIAAQDIDGAVKAARQGVSEEPNSADAHVALTKALLCTGDTVTAARIAKEALLLDPNSAESHIAFGRTLFAMNKKEEAVDEFKQAVNLDPLNAEAHNDLGYALYSRLEVMNAVNEFRLSLRLNPHFSEARNNLEIAIYGLAGNASERSAPKKVHNGI
jgi:Flp pilus assembly protein TadD